MPDDNPYAAPQTAVSFELPDAPRPFGWEPVGKSVFIKQTAQFPMIDPFTGGSNETMMLQKILIRYRPKWLLAFPGAGAVIALVMNKNGESLDLILFLLFGLLAGWALAALVGLMLPVCTLRLFFEKRNLRKRRIISVAAQVLFLACIFGRNLTSMTSPSLRWIGEMIPYLWLIVLLAAIFNNRKLRCVRKHGDRFVIRGFSRRALAALAAETKTGDPQAAR